MLFSVGPAWFALTLLLILTAASGTQLKTLKDKIQPQSQSVTMPGVWLMCLAPTPTFQASVPVMLLASCPIQEHRMVTKK